MKYPVVLSLVLVLIVSSFAFAGTNSAETKKWTFMIFLNADNDLDTYSDWEIGDVAEMKRIGSSADVNIVVLHDRKSKPAMLLYIKKGEVQVLETLGKVDMGDYRELAKFGKWAVEKFPAEHYLLDIWNHGDGWQKRKKIDQRGISYDYSSGHYINTPQLGTAIAEISAAAGKKIDVFGMDACQMQMMEVVYEVKDYTNFVVASEEAEPATGWPYHLVLKPLVDNPAISAEEFSKVIVNAYGAAYPGDMPPVTMSAVDCSKIDAVYDKLDVVGKLLAPKVGEAGFDSSMIKVVKNLAWYDDNTYDLVHFCQLLTAENIDEKINNALSELYAVLAGLPSKAIIANIWRNDFEKNSNGLSIYFPQNYTTLTLDYYALKFSKNSWTTFIKTYLEAGKAKVRHAQRLNAK